MPSTFGRRGLQIGLYAVLLTPLIFGKQLLFPFIVYRTYWFYVLVDLLLVLFFIQYRVNWRAFFDNLIVRIMVVFGLVKVVSDVLGGYFWYSWWGDYERMMGLFTWLHLFLFFFLLVCLLGSVVTERRLVAMNTAVAAAVSIYGLLQYWGIAFVIRQIDPRLFSTVGNPAFLAGYFLLSFWLCLFRLKQASGWQARSWYAAALPLLLVALVLTGTRGALLGLYISSVVLVGYLILYPPSLYKKKVRLIGAAALAALMLLPVFIVLPRFSKYVPEVLHRFKSFSDQSAQSRLRLWQIGWQADLAQPFFGYGENQIGLNLDRLIDPKIKGEWFDSSHNVFVDLSLAHGFIGLLVYLTLLFFVLRAWRQRRNVQPVSAAIMIAAIIGYAVQGLFIFDTLVVLIPLMCLLAITARRQFGLQSTGLQTTDYGLQPLVQSRSQKSEVRSQYLHRGWIGGGGAVFLLAVLLIYTRGVRALSLATDGYRMVQQGKPIEEALANFSEAGRTAFFGYGALAGIARDATLLAINKPDRYPSATLDPLLKQLAESYATAREREGSTSRLYSDLAKVYVQLPSAERLPREQEFHALAAAAMAASPRRFDLYYLEPLWSYTTKDYARAESLVEPLLRLFPEEKSAIFWRLAYIQRLAGQGAKSVASLAQAKKYGTVVARTEYEPFLRQVIAEHDWAAAEQLFLLMLADNPHDTATLANLAEVYKMQGKPDQAKKIVEQLRALDPVLAPQLDLFIKSL